MGTEVFTIRPEPSLEMRRALRSRPFVVIALCAAWCNTCDDFRIGFERLALERDDSTFIWMDIEDDADFIGDVEIENFPTLAIFLRGRLLHFGVSLPQASLVGRLLQSLDDDSRSVDGEADVTSLLGRLTSVDAAATNEYAIDVSDGE